ncbi:MAG TPA: TlpA disulfide reductase family protein [Oligoflexia bacterium]|nr:TlpA disulfide reductase family protein [Oligoflexia bacterium]
MSKPGVDQISCLPQHALRYCRKLLCVLLAALVSCKAASPDRTQHDAPVKTYERFVEGAAAPQFVLKDAQQREVRLSDYANRVVLLNFWATWCVPCVQEMPALQRLSDKLRPRGFEVLSINVNDLTEKKAAMDFVKRNGFTFPVLYDDERSAAASYGIGELPASFIILRRGVFGALSDPRTGVKSVGITAEREWDSPAVAKEIGALVALE